MTQKYDFPSGIVPKVYVDNDLEQRSVILEKPVYAKVVTDDMHVYVKAASNVVEPKHSHYFKDVSKLSTIDVYRVLELFSVSDPCIQHAIKKLLVAGGRGNKDIFKDVCEAIDSLNRWKTMREEDNK